MSDVIHSEGVIQYHRTTEGIEALPFDYNQAVTSLLRWRATLKAFGWVGQSLNRYEGLGFGNISLRIGQRSTHPGHRQFLITGSQTGHINRLEQTDLAWVTRYRVLTNEISHAPLATPSSESLTHAAAYDGHPSLRACIHIHCPTIWNQRDRLGLPRVSKDFGYGTVQMAQRIGTICRQQDPNHIKPIIMDGHQDGVICAAKTPEAAFMSLLTVFQTSIA